MRTPKLFDSPHKICRNDISSSGSLPHLSIVGHPSSFSHSWAGLSRIVTYRFPEPPFWIPCRALLVVVEFGFSLRIPEVLSEASKFCRQRRNDHQRLRQYRATPHIDQSYPNNIRICFASSTYNLHQSPMVTSRKDKDRMLSIGN